jgi:hypothetical protein
VGIVLVPGIVEKTLTAEKVKNTLLRDGHAHHLTRLYPSSPLALALNQRVGSSTEVAKRTRIGLLLVLLSVGAFFLTTMRPGQQWGDDFGLYILHAKNIAEGLDYRQTGYIYNPSLPLIGPQTYPPVFPMLLVPVYKFWGVNFTAMKVELILVFILSLFVIFLAFRDHLPWPYLLALIAVVGFNPYFWQFKDEILSDFPFLLLTYLSLYLIDRAQRQKSSGGLGALNMLLISVSIYWVCPTCLTARSGQIRWIMDAPAEIGNGLINLDRVLPSFL